MAVEAYIQVQPNSTGSKVRNIEVVSPGTPDTGTVEQQVVSIADPDGATLGPLSQGSNGFTAAGPIVQAVVNDSPSSYEVGVTQPLSIAPDGRLRVVAKMSDIDNIWGCTFDDPWSGGDDQYAYPSVANSAVDFAGKGVSQ